MEKEYYSYVNIKVNKVLRYAIINNKNFYLITKLSNVKYDSTKIFIGLC